MDSSQTDAETIVSSQGNQNIASSSVEPGTNKEQPGFSQAERFVEEEEASSKAQPFYFDESEGASAPDGATERFVEEREASSKAQPFHSDESKKASTPGGASNIRIEDVFADIARKFTSFIHFKMFALSGNGLGLSAGEVSTIIADNPDSVEDKKFGMLDLWKEKNGTRASPTLIAEIIKQYFRQERGGVTGSRIEDAFLAVPKVFDNAALFQRFALSGKGLSLSMHEVGNIKENAKNVEERNLDLLVLWKLKTGDSATTEKIWQLVKAFMDERGESHTDQPPLHPRPMELPVAEERAGDAEPLRPDAEPSQADPRPVRQGPAERFIEEGEASSKAQRFHSDEFERASALGGASQSSSEVQAPFNVLGTQGAGKTVPDQSPLNPLPMEPPVAEERAGDAEPLRPDVEPLRSGAEPLRPDAETSQADPRPVRQEPAERFVEEGEASSKAQPFHSNESEGALAPGGAIQISSEVSAVLGSQGARKPVSVSFPKGKFDRAHFGDQHIATQNITNYYGPVVNQDSAQQKRKDAPGAIKAAVGLGEDDEKFQIFKKVINDLTRRNAQPASTIGCLTTPDVKIRPRTADVDFYGSAAENAEYKPELGFSQHTQKQPGKEISMESFFSDGKSRVALVGGAGYGKTEMSKSFSVDVLDQKIPELRGVEVVRHINFRDLLSKKEVSLGKLLFGDTDLDEDVRDHGVGWIILHPEKFLLVIDGADQYASPQDLGKLRGNANHYDKADPKLLINLILAQKLLPGIKLLYSSREHVLRFFEGEVRPERVIALAGFDEESVEKLIYAFSGEHGEYVMNRLKKEARGLLSLCSIPMFLVLTVTVLILYRNLNPKKMTDILLLVLLNTMNSEHMRAGGREDVSIYEVFNRLKKMSFDGMRNKKVTFAESDLPEGITIDHLKDIMIPIPRSIGINQRLFEKNFVFFFIHQSIQEALAALYVAEMPTKQFKKFVSTELNLSHWVVVRRILCGSILNPETSKIAMGDAADVGILKQGIDLKNRRSILLSNLKDQLRPGLFQRKFKGREAVRREDLLELMHALDECGHSADDVIKSFIREMDFYFMPLTPSDKFTLASVLGRCSRLDGLWLHGVPLTSSDLELLASSMQSSNIKIKQASFGVPNEVKEKLVRIAKEAVKNDPPLPHDKAVIFCDILPHITEAMRLAYRVEPEEIEMIQRKLDSIPTTELKVGMYDHDSEEVWLHQRRSEQEQK